MNQSYIPPGMPQMLPYLCVGNPEASIIFYEKAFGFHVNLKESLKDEKGQFQHVHMFFESVHMMFGPEGGGGTSNKTPKSAQTSPGIGLYIYCQDVDALYQKALEAGATSLMLPQDMFWGDRICKVADFDGYEWTFATFIKEKKNC